MDSTSTVLDLEPRVEVSMLSGEAIVLGSAEILDKFE